AALGEPPAAKQAEEVEFALRPHLFERLVIREVDDLDDQSFSEAAKRSWQSVERCLGENVDVLRGRSAQQSERAQGLGGHCAAPGRPVGGLSNDFTRAASSPSTRSRVRAARSARIFLAPAGNSASTRRNVSRGIEITTASSAARAPTRRVVSA